MKVIKYDRKKAIEYAKKWAYSRNKKYLDFENIGGDCTNFISQCIYEGSRVMNYTKDLGWYYINGNNKSPSWTGVEFLYKFLINNKGVGPFGKEIKQEEIELGDIIQLSFDGKKFSHSLIVVRIDGDNSLENIGIATHSFNSYDKKVSNYIFEKIRFIHVEGVRK